MPSNKKENTVSFSVDAALIDRLGRELVQKKETAVAELVKNAYDADATKVNLVFEDTEAPGGTLKIKDDGHGMDFDRFVNAFMRISSSDKIKNPISPKFKRQKAGRKGIGRFSAQTLGSRLTLITKTLEQKKALRITINWDDYSGERDLDSISHEYDYVDVADEEGTLMIIENLREKWTDAQIIRVYKYVSDLIQPLPLSKQKKETEDPGFKAKFYKVKKGEPKAILDEESFIFDYAVAKITAEIDSKGFAKWSVESKRVDLSDKNLTIGPDGNEKREPFNKLKNITLEAHYFIYSSEFIPKRQSSTIRNLANNKGGIRLYRNGFRVRPYGESNDDWLKLDWSVRKRVILPPHGNINFFGYVQIFDPNAKIFEETSSREGLIENDAFDNLKEFIYQVLSKAVLKVAEVRDKKGTTSQKDWESKSSKERLDEASDKLDQLAEEMERTTSKSGSKSNESKKQVEKVRGLASEVKQARDQIAEELGEKEMLRVLASLGLIIGEFTHEIKHFLDGLKYQSQEIIDLSKDIPDLKDISTKFLKDFKGLESYASYFDSNVSEQVNRDRKPIEVQDVVNEFKKTIERDLKRLGIELAPIERKGKGLFTRPMHGSEWASIIYNLYSNSKKAIKRANVKGKLHIAVGKSDSDVYLQFSDNGDGISDINKERIFDAFFTTATPSGPDAKENEDLLGSGLGLKIIKDIINGYNGSIELIKPPKGYSTCFKVSVPKATKEEIKEHVM
ncbi:ATP-binding protein [Gracilimonas sediminicola]|uniref:ATP-binding protein n=1 Tax=Gracilimonas sediminicola TaxID=2952158 RepID=UPI0038D389EC